MTTTLSSTSPGSSIGTVSNTRAVRGRVIGAETLNQELHACKDRQEKLLQILQAPTVPEVPHPERLKFAEYLGHAFQKLPQSIYHDLQKATFDLLYNAEKQADLEAVRSAQAPPQQNQQWQPDPSQWQSRPVVPAVSVWHSRDPTWVNRQFPGYTQCLGQQELIRQRSSQTATYTTPVPSTDSQQSGRFSIAPVLQWEPPFSMSEIFRDIGSTAVDLSTTETVTATTQPDKPELSSL